MKKILIVLSAFLFVACADTNNTKLNIAVTYNNGDVDTFYGVVATDSIIVINKGDVLVKQGVQSWVTLASNVRKYSLIK